MYYLMSPAGKAELFQRTQGAVQQVINLSDLRKIKVPVPPLSEQQRISGILSAYDGLIENNRRRIAVLEQSARLLYREWFVHLRFPGHEHVKVVEGVPERWRRATLGAVSDFIGRGITPTYDDDAKSTVINQKCVRDGMLNLVPARRQSKPIPHQKVVQFGDVLINSTGEGTLGRVAQALQPIPDCTVDSHVTIVRPSREVGKFFLGRALGERESLLKTMGRGSTNQTELARDDIAALPLLLPDPTFTEDFEVFCAPVLRKITVLVEQNKRLMEARDLLLPRLMSGKLQVA